MTDLQRLRVRRCTCGECAPMGTDSSATFDDGHGDPLDWTLADDDVRSWVRADRAADEMPIRSRVWRTAR